MTQEKTEYDGKAGGGERPIQERPKLEIKKIEDRTQWDEGMRNLSLGKTQQQKYREGILG